MAISCELGAAVLKSRGQACPVFPGILNAVLDACTFTPDFSADMGRINTPVQKYSLDYDVPTGRLWWNWKDEEPDAAEWWKNPSHPDVGLCMHFF